MRALEGAPDDAIEWVADHVHEMTFEPAAAIIREGDEERDCYFVVDGRVEISVGGKTRDTDGAGSVLGELGLLFRRPRTATATAVEPVTALRLPAGDFDALAENDAPKARALAAAILDYLHFRFGFEPPDPRWS